MLPPDATTHRSPFRIVSLGEVLWDLLPDGAKLGGAPANFAVHARALGAEATLISRVGDDPLGRQIIDRLTALGLPANGIGVDSSAPTGTVSVELSDGQPRYTIHENAAWDRIAPTSEALAAARECDAICFGTLGQRSEISRATIRELVGAAPADSLRICDINLRPPFVDRAIIEASLELATALKLNDAELPQFAEMFALKATEPLAQLRELAARFHLDTIACTRGGSGSVILHRGEISEHPGVKADVRDTVGAGDSFTAALVLGLLHREPLGAINAFANEVAAFVCSHDGATPALPANLRRRFVRGD